MGGNRGREPDALSCPHWHAFAVAVGFVVLREALSEAGERFYSTLGFAAIMLAGPVYLIWNSFMFGAFSAKEHTGQVPPAIVSLNEMMDLILFLGGGLTYVATALPLGELNGSGAGQVVYS